jgi:excisionase family DNA binding protein
MEGEKVTHAYYIYELIKEFLYRKDVQTSTWLDTEQAATYLGISVGQLRNKTSNGKVPYTKFDRLNRYNRDDLDALLSKNKRGWSADGN